MRTLFRRYPGRSVLGNFLGPLLLGPLFDRWGRRVMISATYAFSGILLLVSGALFYAGLLDATTQTLAWCVVFFFASSAASSAYLTVSEFFPVEMRGIAIALFDALGTGVGAIAPALFGWIVEGGVRRFGYWLATCSHRCRCWRPPAWPAACRLPARAGPSKPSRAQRVTNELVNSRAPAAWLKASSIAVCCLDPTPEYRALVGRRL